MKKTYLLLLGIATLALSIVVISVTSRSSPTVHKPIIAATIYPIFDIARNVAGDSATVNLVLPPGASPHTFELSPQLVQSLQGTQIFFSIGGGLDAWSHAITSSVKDAQEIDLGAMIKSLLPQNLDQEFNPHYWLDPSNAALIAEIVSESLIDLDPHNQQHYKTNLQVYEAELVKLNGFISQRLAPVQNVPIITMHDAWGYFAHAFHLNIVGTFEQSPGKEPTPQELAQLSKLVQDDGVRFIFTEPQLSTQSIDPLARDLNLTIKILDPLGGQAGRESYIDVMKFNTEQLAGIATP